VGSSEPTRKGSPCEICLSCIPPACGGDRRCGSKVTAARKRRGIGLGAHARLAGAVTAGLAARSGDDVPCQPSNQRLAIHRPARIAADAWSRSRIAPSLESAPAAHIAAQGADVARSRMTPSYCLPSPFPALAGEKRGYTGAIPVAAVPVGAVRLQLDGYGNMGICFPV
jgi:hypothetical protein